ncbi:MAG: formate dehydrogenase subunit delta [Pseudomonadota bacterium]
MSDVVVMANQIAKNLARTGDTEAAVARHIAQFWPARMRRALVAAEAAGAALTPTAAGAARRLAEP